MTRRHIHYYILLIILMLTSLSMRAQSSTILTKQDSTSTSKPTKKTRFIQEQVYVMTDRELYMPSDTIWFSAWVVQTATKHKSNLSNYLYVELRDAGGFLQKRVRLKANSSGRFSGYLPINEQITSNTYTLVAYTYHMLCTDEVFFFKKPIDIITPTDMNNGVTLRSLRNRREIENPEPVKSNYTLYIDFDVPENGQYTTSVTNVSMNPNDSAAYITNILPYVPLLYAKGNAPDSVLAFPYEQGSVISGTVYGNFFTKKPQKNLNVDILGMALKMFDKTTTDDNGRFTFNVPDVFADDGNAAFIVQARTKHTIKSNIVFDDVPFPETMKCFRPVKGHFIHITKKEVDEEEQTKLWLSDSRYKKTIMLDEVMVKGRTQNNRTFNNFAEMSINVNDYFGTKIHSFTELAGYLGFNIESDENGMLHFVDFKNGSVVDVYVDDMQMPEYDLNMLDGMYPMEMIMRVDKLDSFQAMHLSGRGFSNNAVVNIILKNPEEMAATTSSYQDFRVARPMVCQKHKYFILNETNYAPPVIYWNPSVLYGNDNKAHVVFKVPDAPNSTYRVMLEGITDNGMPIHQEKYIRITP